MKIAKMKQVVSVVSMPTARITFRFSRPLAAASSIAPRAPSPEASVGVAMPKKMLPSTTRISPKVGSADSRAMPSCRSVSCSASAGRGGTRSGRAKPTTTRNTMYSRPSNTPGISAPMNRSPTDIDTWSAISTSMMDGGIRMPNVPEAATTPDAMALL